VLDDTKGVIRICISREDNLSFENDYFCCVHDAFLEYHSSSTLKIKQKGKGYIVEKVQLMDRLGFRYKKSAVFTFQKTHSTILIIDTLNIVSDDLLIFTLLYGQKKKYKTRNNDL